MSYIKSNLDPGFLNQLNNLFMEDLRNKLGRLNCGIRQNHENSQVTLDFEKINKADIFILHNLCNKHQRAYYIEPNDTSNRVALRINPPVNWH